MLLVSILFGMRHILKSERMNARTHKYFDAKKFESSDFTVWTHERMNADAFDLNSILNVAYLKVWTHERTNAQIFWWQKILELWLSWFERTNAWTQKVFEWGICQSLNAWTHERWWILMLKNLRALNFLVWAHERMNTEAFGLHSVWNEAYIKVWMHERTNAQKLWCQKSWELWLSWFESTNAWT